ncbi:uncharacterized protein LOC127808518 [Diospyros lotus]|uniref:uncharacterized protein LOC127808518 n=1 Tax=Diospyros lotus TaxID=55363 RepID=UPI00225555EC|nr:uncharacterized protein LOC127808518 [Diospyros lotus]
MSITVDADFTFPATADAPPRLLDSPPLWHSSSTPSCHGQRKALATNNAIARRRKSFSYAERGLKGDDEEEDKMDMLWEDFDDSKGACYGSGMEPAEVTSPGRVAAELGCAGALNKLSKRGGGGAVFSGKKPSAVVLVKVLKKLFLLRNYTQRSVKKPTW